MVRVPFTAVAAPSTSFDVLYLTQKRTFALQTDYKTQILDSLDQQPHLLNGSAKNQHNRVVVCSASSCYSIQTMTATQVSLILRSLGNVDGRCSSWLAFFSGVV